MKTQKNILIAFILNLTFSVFEVIGGIYTGSVAIISDAVHDFGDAASIGISYMLEKKSKKKPDDDYTYGYQRFSVIGSVITTLILLFGSAAVIYNAIGKIINPTEINYNGMIAFAVVGVAVNFLAALVTRHGDSLNQKAVNLHMLEDVLGWVVVLVGAVVMRFTDFSLIDPVMSIGVSVFILINAVKNLKLSLDVFLERAPQNISIDEIKEHLQALDDVIDVHHIHLWTIDGESNYATMHIVTNGEAHRVKHKVRDELAEFNIHHATLELEAEQEHCHETDCQPKESHHTGHHHHHHQH